MESKLNQIIQDQFESLENKLNGDKSLPIHAVRKGAIKQIAQAGLPGNKDEEYKFTRLTSYLEKHVNLQLANIPSNIGEEDIDGVVSNDIEGTHLIFINDKLSIELSSIHPDHESVEIIELSKSSRENPESFNHYFNKNESFSNDGFLAWNTALTENGVHIRVGRSASYDKPISLYFLSDASKQQVINRPRVLIELGENSEITFIERSITIGENVSFNNSVIDIICEKATRGGYIKIQNDKDSAIQMGTTQIYQPDSSTFTCFTFTFSGAMIRNNLNFISDGEGVESNMYGLYISNGSTHVDNHTTVDHQKPNSVSNELYKGIMNGQSRGVFNGKIFVRQAAQKTNAFQANNNILLSNEATINTKPQLEIWADDVKCSHGCTIGQLDEEQIFYLRSRGLDKDSALNMLLHAFAADVLERMSIDNLKEEIEKLITTSLSQ